MRLLVTLTACYMIGACYVCSYLSRTLKGIRVDPVFPFCSFQSRYHVYILGQAQTQIQQILIPSTFISRIFVSLGKPFPIRIYLMSFFFVSLNHVTHIRLAMIERFIFKTEEQLGKLCSPYSFLFLLFYGFYRLGSSFY